MSGYYASRTCMQCIPSYPCAETKKKKKKLYLRLGEIWYKPVLAAPIHKSRPVFVPRALAKVLN
jgi:hypothetical protein